MIYRCWGNEIECELVACPYMVWKLWVEIACIVCFIQQFVRYYIYFYQPVFSQYRLLNVWKLSMSNASVAWWMVNGSRWRVNGAWWMVPDEGWIVPDEGWIVPDKEGIVLSLNMLHCKFGSYKYAYYVKCAGQKNWILQNVPNV